MASSHRAAVHDHWGCCDLHLDAQPNEEVRACVNPHIVVQQDQCGARVWIGAAVQRVISEISSGRLRIISGEKGKAGVGAANGFVQEEPILWAVLNVQERQGRA